MVELHDMSNDSIEDIKEPERDEEKTIAEVAKTSEVVARKTMKVVNETMSNP
jgi:hypothetical protein